MVKSIAIFCGSSEGYNENYMDTAWQLGETLAQRGIRVIYGGAKIGLMGAVADGALEAGGEVIGVIPNFLSTTEVAHEGLTRLITVETMHERKLKMHELSDAVITLPGGWGTMEEMFEMLTWAQLGLHKKPIALLNINGFYDSLKVLFNNMVIEGFLKESTNEIMVSSESIEELLEMIEQYEAPEIDKLLTRQKT